MSIYLATGVTPGYVERARQFLDTAQTQCNLPVTVFAVNHQALPDGHGNLGWWPCDYPKLRAPLPKWMLQNGAFTEFAPPHWKDLDTIIFVDADAYFQRPFIDAELDFFRSVSLGELSCGYNMPNHEQTLLDEAKRISPLRPLLEISQRFPGIENMVCRNFGFVVADFATWKDLYRYYLAIHPAIEQCFANPARVQWGSLYAAQSNGMRIVELSPVIHAQAHCGLKNGLAKGADGLWRQDGEVVAYAHAL